MASFDRRECKGPLNGPTATGQHCSEGWTSSAEPLPQLGNVTGPGSGEGSYYTWVDQFNTLGLGANVPINTGNQSEGLLVLKDGKWVVLRVPYPMGFYTKWLGPRPPTRWQLRCVKPFLTRDVGCDEIRLRCLAGIAIPRKAFRTGHAATTRDVRHSEGNYQSYIEDLKRRKGPDADQPHRVAYRKLVRA